jgi:hypothetical protein
VERGFGELIAVRQAVMIRIEGAVSSVDGAFVRIG